MFIVDTNVLVYAANADDVHHGPAKSWLGGALGSGETVGFAWSALVGFLRISTNPRLLASPITANEATDQIRRWLAPPNAVTLDPTPRHMDLLAGLLDGTDATGTLVNDAHIAALALEYGATVVSWDTDFALFGVDWMRPKGA